MLMVWLLIEILQLGLISLADLLILRGVSHLIVHASREVASRDIGSALAALLS
jgi:hypothetical protein